jgi:hypothetical protein
MKDMNYIKIPDLKPGYLYRIHARNASYGIWFGDTGTTNAFGFAISRIKFGDNFIFTEYHWDMPSFATARPLEEIEKSPFSPEDLVHKLIIYDGAEGYSHIKVGEKFWTVLKHKEILEYLNKYEDVARKEAAEKWERRKKGALEKKKNSDTKAEK